MPYIGNNFSSVLPTSSANPGPQDPGRFDAAAFARLLGGGISSAGRLFTGADVGLILTGMNAISGGSSGGSSDKYEMQQLIDRQIQSQMQMQVFSARSNIEKTEHDTRMTAIQNMRA